MTRNTLIGTPVMARLKLQLIFLLAVLVIGAVGDPKQAALEGHNKHRKNGGLTELVWDSNLEESATAYSKKLGEETSCGDLSHSGGNVGENLYMQWSSNNEPTDIARDAAARWYGEVKDYEFSGGQKDYMECKSVFKKVGHLTQMMWSETKKLGCGGYDCGNKYVYTCHYSPGGNVQGQPMFSNENFKKLCKNEPGKWKTCNKDLKEQCNKNAKNANSNDKTNGSPEKEQEPSSGNNLVLTKRSDLMISCLAIITLYITMQ